MSVFSQNLLYDIIQKTKTQGADHADVILIKSTMQSIKRRSGQSESLERSEAQDLGLRILIGKKQTIVSTTDFSRDQLDIFIEQAIARVKLVPDDPYCGLATAEQTSTNVPNLNLYDESEPDIKTMIGFADEADEHAQQVKGITNSDGATSSWSKSHIYYAASNGFLADYKSSSFSLSSCVLAGEGVDMERDYDFTSGKFLSDLESAAAIGTAAGQKTIKRLNPRKALTKAVPVVFDPRVGNGLVSALASAVSGSAITRGTSLLKESMQTQVFNKGISIIDDPFILKGMRSRPFDGEGLAPQKMALIDKGVLKTWLLDLSSARQLGLNPTGHASRSPSSLPHPGSSNLYLEAGDLCVADLISDIKEGFYVTDLMGHGVNIVTGDFSRGASGFWIKNGQISYPVNGATIAGNLKTMWLNTTAANDLEFKYGINSPTLRVETMTVAGA